MDLATIRWFGRPKVTRARLGELKMVNERLGCVNTVVQVGRGTAPLHKFYVDWRKSPAVVKEPEAIGQIGKMVIKWQEDGIKTTETLKKQKKIAETWGKGAM